MTEKYKYYFNKEVILMIILASASPRRKEILEKADMEFEIKPASKEINPPSDTPPSDYVVLSASAKAREIAEKYAEKGDIVIGADTIVVYDNKKLGKPRDEHDAFTMLKALSGRTHCVYTGYSLIKDGEEIVGHSVTEVVFRDLSDDEITSYVATREPLDKAGGYAIQGKGSVFVKKINGDYYNVVGLPLCEIYSIIKSLQNH